LVRAILTYPSSLSDSQCWPSVSHSVWQHLVSLRTPDLSFYSKTSRPAPPITRPLVLMGMTVCLSGCHRGRAQAVPASEQKFLQGSRQLVDLCCAGIRREWFSIPVLIQPWVPASCKSSQLYAAPL
jgi:hypothetical protein